MFSETINVVCRNEPSGRVVAVATFAVEFTVSNEKLTATARLIAANGQATSDPAVLGLSSEDFEMASHVAELQARDRIVYLRI